jgi:hypothetical protein
MNNIIIDFILHQKFLLDIQFVFINNLFMTYFKVM